MNHTHKLLLCSPAMEPLTKRIHERLVKQGIKIEMAVIGYTAFANGEGKPLIPFSVRRHEVYLLWDFHPNPNEQLIRLYLTCMALHLSSVASISLILPYLPYMRQDRKAEGREPISARHIADLLELCPKVTNILTLDLHADQEQGFFKNPLDNLPGALVFAQHFRELYQGKYDQLVAISTDEGGVVRVRRFADMISPQVQVFNFGKRRPRANEAAITYFNGKGEINGRDAIFLDDMIDTAGSLKSSVTALREENVGTIYIAATHGIFSPKEEQLNGAKRLVSAEERLQNLNAQVFVTESIPRDNSYLAQHQEWLHLLPLDKLLAEALYETFSTDGHGSLSKLIKAWSEEPNS